MTDPITKAVEALETCRFLASARSAHRLREDIDAALSDLRALQQTHVTVPKEPKEQSAGWQPIASAPKDGRPIQLGFMEDGEITQTAEMQWSHIQRNGLFPGVVGMWVCPGGNFTWNPEPAEFGPSHWRPLSAAQQEQQHADQA